VTTLDEIQNYFEELCRNHKDLLHQDNGNRAFARLNTDDHITQIKKKATQNIIVVAAINGQRIGDVDDQQMRWGLSLIFASRAVTSGNLGSAIDVANNTSAEIMFDFISKMQLDMMEDCGIQNLEVEKISWDDIEGPWLDFYYGWMLFVPFKADMPLYNEAKWNNA